MNILIKSVEKKKSKQQQINQRERNFAVINKIWTKVPNKTEEEVIKDVNAAIVQVRSK